MDKFEETMKMMAKMSDEERTKAVEMNKSLCICGGCPFYNDCAKEKGEVLNYSLEPSPVCIKEVTACICVACPVTSKKGLKNQYFCTKGSEKEQRM